MVLRKLVSLIFDYNAKPPVPEAPFIEEDEECDGKIGIEYSCKDGQLYVSAAVEDASETSADLLARTCLRIETGEIAEFVYQALSVWAQEDIHRLQFMEKVAIRLMELRGTEKGKKKLAVDPSQVFDFRNIKE